MGYKGSRDEVDNMMHKAMSNLNSKVFEFKSGEQGKNRLVCLSYSHALERQKTKELIGLRLTSGEKRDSIDNKKIEAEVAEFVQNCAAYLAKSDQELESPLSLHNNKKRFYYMKWVDTNKVSFQEYDAEDSEPLQTLSEPLQTLVVEQGLIKRKAKTLIYVSMSDKPTDKTDKEEFLQLADQEVFEYLSNLKNLIVQASKAGIGLIGFAARDNVEKQEIKNILNLEKEKPESLSDICAQLNSIETNLNALFDKETSGWMSGLGHAIKDEINSKNHAEFTVVNPIVGNATLKFSDYVKTFISCQLQNKKQSVEQPKQTATPSQPISNSQRRGTEQPNSTVNSNVSSVRHSVSVKIPKKKKKHSSFQVGNRTGSKFSSGSTGSRNNSNPYPKEMDTSNGSESLRGEIFRKISRSQKLKKKNVPGSDNSSLDTASNETLIINEFKYLIKIETDLISNKINECIVSEVNQAMSDVLSIKLKNELHIRLQELVGKVDANKDNIEMVIQIQGGAEKLQDLNLQELSILSLDAVRWENKIFVYQAYLNKDNVKNFFFELGENPLLEDDLAYYSKLRNFLGSASKDQVEVGDEKFNELSLAVEKGANYFLQKAKLIQELKNIQGSLEQNKVDIKTYFDTKRSEALNNHLETENDGAHSNYVQPQSYLNDQREEGKLKRTPEWKEGKWAQAGKKYDDEVASMKNKLSVMVDNLINTLSERSKLGKVEDINPLIRAFNEALEVYQNDQNQSLNKIIVETHNLVEDINLDYPVIKIEEISSVDMKDKTYLKYANTYDFADKKQTIEVLEKEFSRLNLDYEVNKSCYSVSDKGAQDKKRLELGLTGLSELNYPCQKSQKNISNDSNDGEIAHSHSQEEPFFSMEDSETSYVLKEKNKHLVSSKKPITSLVDQDPFGNDKLIQLKESQKQCINKKCEIDKLQKEFRDLKDNVIKLNTFRSQIDQNISASCLDFSVQITEISRINNTIQLEAEINAESRENILKSAFEAKSQLDKAIDDVNDQYQKLDKIRSELNDSSQYLSQDIIIQKMIESENIESDLILRINNINHSIEITKQSAEKAKERVEARNKCLGAIETTISTFNSLKTQLEKDASEIDNFYENIRDVADNGLQLVCGMSEAKYQAKIQGLISNIDRDLIVLEEKQKEILDFQNKELSTDELNDFCDATINLSNTISEEKNIIKNRQDEHQKLIDDLHDLNQKFEAIKTSLNRNNLIFSLKNNALILGAPIFHHHFSQYLACEKAFVLCSTTLGDLNKKHDILKNNIKSVIDNQETSVDVVGTQLKNLNIELNNLNNKYKDIQNDSIEAADEFFHTRNTTSFSQAIKNENARTRELALSLFRELNEYLSCIHAVTKHIAKSIKVSIDKFDKARKAESTEAPAQAGAEFLREIQNIVCDLPKYKEEDKSYSVEQSIGFACLNNLRDTLGVQLSVKQSSDKKQLRFIKENKKIIKLETIYSAHLTWKCFDKLASPPKAKSDDGYFHGASGILGGGFLITLGALTLPILPLSITLFALGGFAVAAGLGAIGHNVMINRDSEKPRKKILESTQQPVAQPKKRNTNFDVRSSLIPSSQPVPIAKKRESGRLSGVGSGSVATSMPIKSRNNSLTRDFSFIGKSIIVNSQDTPPSPRSQSGDAKSPSAPLVVSITPPPSRSSSRSHSSSPVPDVGTPKEKELKSSDGERASPSTSSMEEPKPKEKPVVEKRKSLQTPDPASASVREQSMFTESSRRKRRVGNKDKSKKQQKVASVYDPGQGHTVEGFGFEKK